MTDIKPHFSFWVVAAIGLVWNLLGCLNFVAQTNPENVAQLPEAYQLIISNRPVWATIAFAVGVFGGAAGCLLMLLRRREAVLNFALSLVGIVVTSGSAAMQSGFGPSLLLSVLVGGALLWYATIARRKDWLR